VDIFWRNQQEYYNCKGKDKGKAGIAVHGTPSHSYSTSVDVILPEPETELRVRID